MRSLVLVLLFFPQILLSQEYDAEILEYKTKCSIRNGKLITEKSFRIKVLNKGGERFTKVVIPHTQNEPVSIEEAYVEDKNGIVVRKLGKKEITTSSDQSSSVLFSDTYNYSFTLRHNTFPYIIFYRFIQTSSAFFSIADWSPAYDSRIPTRSAELEIYTPYGYDLRISESRIEHFRVDSIKGYKIYRWTSQFDNPIKHEIFMVHPMNYYPVVRVRPMKFTYGTEGSHESWLTYGNWEASLLENTLDLPPSEAEKVRSITSGCRNDIEKISTLYHYMQDNTRYINVDIGIGGWKPYPASYVAEKKYGDCKALSNYMCSLLGAAGIKAYYTNIYSGRTFPENDPGNFNFPVNHALVCVPMPTDTIWLECTDNICPAGYLGSSTQGRQAFLIEKNNSRFLVTPSLRIDDVKNSWNLKFEVSANGLVNGNMHFRFRGSDFELLNTLKNYIPREEQEEFLYELIGLSDFTINKWELQHPHRDSSFVDLSISISIPGYVKSYGNMVIVKPLSLPVPGFELPEQRKTDVLIPYPLYTVDSTEYLLPDYFKTANVPADTLITSGYGIYHRQIVSANTRITIIKSLLVYPSRYSTEQYAGFYRFISQVRDEESKIVSLKNK